MVSFTGSAALAAVMGALFTTGSFLPAIPLLDPGDDGPDRISERLEAVLQEGNPDAEVGIIVLTHLDGAQAAARASELGIDAVWTYDVIDGFSAVADAPAIDRLAQEEWVESIWDSRAVSTTMDNSARDIGADSVWDAGYNGEGVTVAVIDTGIDVLDPAFSGAISACVAAVAGVILPECDDTNGHGTHVAGTVAARDDTYRGIAWGAHVAAVRVLHVGGAGTSADVIAGMEWVAANHDRVEPAIRVATMSIGFTDPGCGDGESPEARAADALVAAGVSFTVAAGNAGHETCTVDGASAAFDVVTVGAADDRDTADPSDDTLADFSSAGPTEDGRIKPEVVAPGVGIRSVYVGPFIAELDGTSMATPHVAGVLALMVEKDPELSPEEAKQRLIDSAFAPEAAGDLPNEDWGHGLVDACHAVNVTGCRT